MSTKEKGRVRLPRLIGLAESGVGFLLGGVLAGAEMFSQYSPFGVAAVAAAGSGLPGFCTTVGAVLGYLCLSGLTDGMRYGAAAILTYSVAFAFFDTRFYQSDWFMPSIASLLTAATGFVCRGGNGWHGEDFVYFATEILFTGVAAWCYRILFQSWPETLEGLRDLSPRQQAALLMLGSTVLMSLARVELLELFSLGRLMAAAGVMLCARRGAAAGVLTGACAGVSLDLASGEPPYCSLVFSLAGLACGLCRDKSRISAALAYIGTASVAVLWVEEGAGIPLESVLGSVLFLILPDLPFGGGAGLRGEEGQEGEVARRLMGLSEAYRSLHESMEETLSGTVPENPAEIFTRTADAVCGKCSLKMGCWQREYQETREVMNNATGPILERGRALVTDFPLRFSEKCLQFPAFLGEVNRQLTEYLRRRQTRKRQEETRTMLCRQYARMDTFLQKTAAEFSTELTPAARGERLRAVASLVGERKRGEEVSGDTGLWFRRGDGILCFLLCDGMGSGEGAQEESRRCASLLENFLRAGMEPEAAMETVATALALRGEGTSTVDLLTMDLHTGQCAVYKQGASPTYVRQGNKLRYAVSHSLPAGSAPGVGADRHAFQGEAGDWVILFTDGVLCGGEEDWLKELLLSYAGESPRELADTILRQGGKRNGGEDDATVLVIHLEENRE